eukprot:11502972-Karenia_brevis.AAC.1
MYPPYEWGPGRGGPDSGKDEVSVSKLWINDALEELLPALAVVEKRRFGLPEFRTVQYDRVDKQIWVVKESIGADDGSTDDRIMTIY